jgi:hypothetical protein
MLTAIVNALQFPVVVQFAPTQFFSDFQITTTTQT